ncbi:MAG: DUF86 domain-containing protein [Anaerolineae bacterium]|nr:DUF86 domain-containing protein [Anaerolineae bacterium]
MNADDRLRLQHMLEAAREVQTFTQGRKREDLDTNKLLVRGLSMSTGIIGEAASHRAPERRDAHPEIPWRLIIGMRNVLIHEYFRVDLDLLWDTSVKSIPPLVTQLEAILASIPPEPN